MGVAGVTLWFLTSMGVPGPAHAQVDDSSGRADAIAGGVERHPAVASFEGRSLDLAQDWGDARACLVWRQGGVLECFRTPEALDAREAQLSPAAGGSRSRDASSDAVTASYDFSYTCSSPLRLYDFTYYGGRQLSFWDRGYWQNLWDYGFDDRTSSYIVGGCYSHLAEHPDGGGWWYGGPTYPYAGEPVMSWAWQNTISSIFIN